jgi:hypothetical protein
MGLVILSDAHFISQLNQLVGYELSAENGSQSQVSHVFKTRRIFTQLCAMFFGEGLRLCRTNGSEAAARRGDKSADSLVFQSQAGGDVTAHRIPHHVITIKLNGVNESFGVSHPIFNGVVLGITRHAESRLIEGVNAETRAGKVFHVELPTGYGASARRRAVNQNKRESGSGFKVKSFNSVYVDILTVFVGHRHGVSSVRSGKSPGGGSNIEMSIGSVNYEFLNQVYDPFIFPAQQRRFTRAHFWRICEADREYL